MAVIDFGSRTQRSRTCGNADAAATRSLALLNRCCLLRVVSGGDAYNAGFWESRRSRAPRIRLARGSYHACRVEAPVIQLQLETIEEQASMTETIIRAEPSGDIPPRERARVSEIERLVELAHSTCQSCPLVLSSAGIHFLTASKSSESGALCCLLNREKNVHDALTGLLRSTAVSRRSEASEYPRQHIERDRVAMEPGGLPMSSTQPSFPEFELFSAAPVRPCKRSRWAPGLERVPRPRDQQALVAAAGAAVPSLTADRRRL